MKLRYKILNGFLIVVAVAIISLAFILSHNSACEPAPAVAGNTETMKAVTYQCYGSPEVLELVEVEMPTPADDEVVVKVHAASVNPYDWHNMRGSPYLMRLGTGIGKPKNTRLGVDFAGVVEAVGDNVTKFKPGDEVFGGAGGAFAEYVTVSEDKALVLKPPNMTFEQAASVPIAGVTALQALRDKGKIEPGMKVLINGASGGVGTFAVQIAKSYGAEVTGVCSTRNVEMVKSIGADHVIDYKNEDYTESGEQYDLIIDMVGNHSLLKNKKVMSPDGTFVIVGAESGDWIAPLMRPVNAMALSPFVDQEFIMILARMSQDDLVILGDMMAAGKVTPVVDRSYRLDEISDAMRYSEDGHARGKIIIALEQDDD